MSDTDQAKEDEVLRRMLNTPPKPHKPAEESSPKDEQRDNCPICHGKGKVPIIRQPDGYRAPLTSTKFIKCEDCGGSGKK